MIAEVGHGLLWLALACALLLAVAGFWPRLNDLAVPVALATGWLWLWVLGAIAWVFWSLDLSVAAVAANTQSRLPEGLRLAAAVLRPGGGWPVAAAAIGIAGAVAALRRDGSRTLGGFGLASAMLTAIVLTGAPFARLVPAPTEGAGFDSGWRARLAGLGSGGTRVFDGSLAPGTAVGAVRLAAITPVGGPDSTGVAGEVRVGGVVLLPEWRETILPRAGYRVADIAWTAGARWRATLGPPDADVRWSVTVERLSLIPLYLALAGAAGAGALAWRRRR